MLKKLIRLYKMFYRLRRLDQHQRQEIIAKKEQEFREWLQIERRYRNFAFDEMHKDYNDYKSIACHYRCRNAKELKELLDQTLPIRLEEEQRNNKMKKLIQTKHDLLTTKYTEVFEESEFTYNAPHYFEVVRRKEHDQDVSESDILAKIHFQEGPIKECGVNGVNNEDLIIMVIRRLEGFQNSEFKCRENACAITKLEEALMWLRKRTMGRENRGVEGTHTV